MNFQMDENTVIYLSLIGFLAVSCQILAWYIHIPAILFLLIAGIIIGPVFNLLNPDQLFGNLLLPITSLAVAVILFEGSLTLRFSELKGQGKTITNLIVFGPTITWAGISVIAYYATTFHWETAMLFGAIMVVSGPTVIKPILETVKPQPTVAKPLHWESIILDPLAGLLAALVVGFIISNHDRAAVQQSVIDFISMVSFGLIYGVINGYLLSEVIKRHWLPNILENIVVLNWVVIAFVSANYLLDETGLIAVTIMGLTIANRSGISLESILDFKETISTLLLSGLFIVLAARIEFNDIHEVVPQSLAIFFFMQFIIQPLKVAITTMGSKLSWREKFLIAWIAPRGIIAAALVSIFAVTLHELGYPQAESLIPITFLIIVYSVTLPSLTAGFLAKLLGLALPKANGVLIIGANKAAREIAKMLLKHDIPVIVTDSSWENISAARLAHIPVYFGNPTSDNADRNLDLTRIGKLFAITPNPELSTLARLKYRSIFGRDAIYYLKTSSEKKSSERHLIAQTNRGKVLFNESMTYQQLASLISKGAELKSTLLTESFTLQDYKNKHKSFFTLLFVFNKSGELLVNFDEKQLEPGYTLISLMNQARG